MSVMMQAFYWDSPVLENREGNWWNAIAERVEALGQSGWDGHDAADPDERTTDGDGQAEFAAPPRGFAVYVPVFDE